MKLEDIELALEDIDSMVELARQTYTTAGFLGIVHSANLIRAALEKQIEKEPEWVIGSRHHSDNVKAYCDECREELIEDYPYCPKCGQRILWK